jgi:site-specific recombinase XerD
MADCSIQSIWQAQLREWPQEIQETIFNAFKKSTQRSYNGFAKRFATFCNSLGKNWKDASTLDIAKYLMEVARDKERPKSTLDQALASISAMYELTDTPSPTHSTIITRLRKGLINQTTEPIQRGGAIPPEAIANLFHSWGVNEKLTTDQLRLKAMALVAFVGMFRPSDLALPLQSNLQFKENDTAVTFCLLGFKNDYDANGAEVTIPSSTDPILCPVQALKCYLERTQPLRSGLDSKLFIATKKPFGGLTAQRCSKLLQQVAQQAGLDPQLFTGRTFRRGGATTAINHNINPDVVMKMGRWKSPQVMYEHYVRAKPNQSYTDQVFGDALLDTQSLEPDEEAAKP